MVWRLALSAMGCSLVLLAGGNAFASAELAGGVLPDSGRLHLSCTGTLATSDKVASPTSAGGFVDLVNRRVSGFGVGSAPIVFVTAARVDFASPKQSGVRISGSIDRTNGNTVIDVFTSEAGGPVISMRLDCGFDAPAF